MTDKNKKAKTDDSEIAEKLDMQFLKEAFEAFNMATAKLEQSYSIVQDEAKKLREEVEEKNSQLSELSNLLEAVLMNSTSSIIALNKDHTPVVKNSSAEKMMTEIGEETMINMLKEIPAEGVYEHEPVKGIFLKVSAGILKTENIDGNVYVVDDITHLKRLEVEKQRDEKLMLMGEMAANIAHEIRNPLGGIELFASLLGRDLEGDAEKKKLTGSIIKGVRTINSIISNILLFTKEIQIDKENCYVADIVDDVVLYLQHLMRDKGIKFKNLISEDHKILCDNELCKQVVMNIVHNAVEAVPEDGQVQITSFEEEKFTGFCVRDSGCGIKPDMKKKLFMPFQTTKAKGTGLGLAIVYKIIKAHGGNIEVDSDGCSFTEFKVSMPKF